LLLLTGPSNLVEQVIELIRIQIRTVAEIPHVLETAVHGSFGLLLRYIRGCLASEVLLGQRLNC
jgi:hypothetical protein